MLRDRAAVVAGAGRGIGRAIAIEFARNGAQLTLVARSVDELEETAVACRSVGALAEVVQADVSRWAQVEQLTDAAADVLVNAAGVYGPIGPTADVDADEWTAAVDVNLVGTYHLCRAVVPGMVRRGRGKVILLAGGGATAPLPRFSSYAAAKAAVVRLAETLAHEVADSGVQVNAIAPGLVDTKLQDEVLAAGARAGDLLERIRAARETGAGTVPADVAAALAVFLASDESGGLTGKLISAPHDPWRTWSDAADVLNIQSLYTIRRLDPLTLDELRAVLT